MTSTIQTARAQLREKFVGKNIRDVPTPAAILDVSIVKRNCQRMLDACQAMGFGFRAHVKTHKTLEITQFQVGDRNPVNLIVSTVVEAERLVPYLLDCKSQDRRINVLYGLPVPPSQIPRLAALAKELGPGSISLMIDHPSQLEAITKLSTLSEGIVAKLFVKIDMGGRRAGVTPDSQALKSLAEKIHEYQQSGFVELLGLYAHAGHSYYRKGPAAALDMLRQELEALDDAVSVFEKFSNPLTLSVGASPTAMSLGNLDVGENVGSKDAETVTAAVNLQATIDRIRQESASIEVHAGVYTVLDLQQFAVHALPSTSWSNIAVTIMAEVSSIYPGRGEGGSTEALIAGGSLALGREPCKAYSGWGILTPWNLKGASPQLSDWENSIEKHRGWQVGRISQEHGILTLKGGGESESNDAPLEVGQKVRVFPNHACIVLSGYSHLLVVDSSKAGEEDIICDAWLSLQGWG
ncbi:hypothetical protein FQN54_002924 [Arachnomyces sp. PD_36]|nr:hypothetical protein FQN54_002924 [Arachnomyces sp. PD_36]